MIFVTPNPAIDRTLLLPALQVGQVHRATQTIVAAGGKGLNAARVARILGADPLCMGFLGGLTGQDLAGRAAREGLRAAWTWTDSETRACVILAAADGSSTVINEPGNSVASDSWRELAAQIRKHARPGELVAFCGSTPPWRRRFWRFVALADGGWPSGVG